MTDLAAPKVETGLGFYLFEWVEAGVRLKLDHLRESSDALRAEGLFETKDSAGKWEFLEWLGSWNLKAATGGKALAEKMNQRRNGLDWAGMLTQATYTTVQAWRKGEAIQGIGSEPVEDKPKWRLYPFIPEGMVGVLFGPGGSAKSTLAISLALSIHQGIPLLGLSPVKGNVLYLDWEENYQAINEKALKLAAGLDLWLPPPPYFFYRRCRRPLLDDIEDLTYRIAEAKVSTIIVDSAVKACGGEKEARENGGTMLAALSNLGVSCLLIGHIAKDLERKTRTPYGSVFFINDPRHVNEVRPVNSPGASFLDVGYYWQKSNLVGKYPSFSYRFSFDDVRGIGISRQDISEVPELDEARPVGERIRHFLSRGAKSSIDIADELNANENTVRGELHRLTKKKQALKLPSGLWGLLTPAARGEPT